MSINISEKNFRIRMTKEQFNLLKKDGGFSEQLADEKNLFSYSILLTKSESPTFEFRLNEIKVFLPISIISKLEESSKKEGVIYSLPNSVLLTVQIDIIKMANQK